MIKLKISAATRRTASPGQRNATAIGTDLRPFHLLYGCDIFRDLPQDSVEPLAQRARAVSLPAGGVLFRVGDPVTVFLLAAGRLKISRACATGLEMMVQILGPGDLCGWPHPRGTAVQTTTARALEPLQAFALPSDALEALLRRFPAFAWNVLHLLARRVEEAQEHYLELAHEQVPQRLARTLLRLSRSGGCCWPGVPRLDVPLSRAELAQITGTTLFTVSRVLSRWDNQGLVHARRGRVSVANPQRLGRIAKARTSSAS